MQNGKKYVKIFPAGGDPAILPREIYFHVGIQRDVLFVEKVVLCYRCNDRHILGENCLVATSTPEESAMPFIEQRWVLLHHIKILCNLIFLRRITLAVNSPKNILL